MNIRKLVLIGGLLATPLLAGMEESTFDYALGSYLENELSRSELIAAYDKLNTAEKEDAQSSLEKKLNATIDQLREEEGYLQTFVSLIELYNKRELSKKDLIAAYDQFTTDEDKALADEELKKHLKVTISELRTKNRTARWQTQPKARLKRPAYGTHRLPQGKAITEKKTRPQFRRPSSVQSHLDATRKKRRWAQKEADLLQSEKNIQLMLKSNDQLRMSIVNEELASIDITDKESLEEGTDDIERLLQQNSKRKEEFMQEGVNKPTIYQDKPNPQTKPSNQTGESFVERIRKKGNEQNSNNDELPKKKPAEKKADSQKSIEELLQQNDNRRAENKGTPEVFDDVSVSIGRYSGLPSFKRGNNTLPVTALPKAIASIDEVTLSRWSEQLAAKLATDEKRVKALTPLFEAYGAPQAAKKQLKLLMSKTVEQFSDKSLIPKALKN